jgi:hypothetical protein
MHPDELARLLTGLGAAFQVVHALVDPDLRALHGWDLQGWSCEISPNTFRFVRQDAQGKTTGAVLAVNAPKEDRALYGLPPAPWPKRVVMLR